jgi:hypothetical protein
MTFQQNKLDVAMEMRCFNVFLVSYLTTLLIVRLYTIDDRIIYECGAVGGIRNPLPLCPPQIQHDLALDRTQTTALRSQRLTA